MPRAALFASGLGLSLVMGLSPSAARAMTFMEVEIVCPIDGKTFSTRVMGSGTAFGRYFDGQHYGAIASPAPLPACPDNGFIVADPQRRYGEAELTRLRAFVDSPRYRGWVADDTPYYRLAQQMIFLGESQESLDGILLAATWEAGARYPRYAEQALQAWQRRVLRAAGKDRDAEYGARLLVGELQRRLGRFDEALATFEALRADPGFPGGVEAKTAAYLRQVLDAQLQLIRDRSVAHARLDEDGKVVDF